MWHVLKQYGAAILEKREYKFSPKENIGKKVMNIYKHLANKKVDVLKQY